LLSRRVELAHPEERLAWRGPLLAALVMLRELAPTLPSTFQPLAVLDDGKICRLRALCLDLRNDLGMGDTAIRAVPSYLRGLRSLLLRFGASSAAKDAPGALISETNPFLGEAAASEMLVAAINNPLFADIVFQLGGGEEAHGHRLLLGRASEAFQAMVSGPLAVAAAQPDGRLHIVLPPFVELAPWLFVLAYLYTGRTDETAEDVAGVGLQPPSFPGAEFVCSVMQIADHYLLPHLKQWCEVYLSQPELLTVESIVDILTHADACNAPQLFHVCAHQIGILQEAVQQTEAWATISEPLRQRALATVRGRRPPPDGRGG